MSFRTSPQIPRLPIFLAFVLLLAACDDVLGLSVDDHLQKALEHRTKGDFQSSLLELKSAIQKDPEHAEARWLAGSIYLDWGRLDSAEKELLRARDLGRPWDELFRPLGEAWILQSKHGQVLKQIRASELSDAEAKAASHVLRGQARMGLKQHRMAIDEFRNALLQVPDYRPALVELAKAALLSGQIGRAETLIDQAGADDSGDIWDVNRVRADLYVAQKKFDLAETVFRDLVGQRSRPYDIAAQLGLAATLTAQEKFKEAVERLDEVLVTLPNNPYANYLRGIVAYETMDYATAKQYAEKVVALDPLHKKGIWLNGVTAQALGQEIEAERFFSRYLGMEPGDKAVRRTLGELQIRIGRSNEAVRTLSQLARELPDDPTAQVLAASAASHVGDLRSSKTHLERAAELDPESGAYQEQLGRVEIGLGELESGTETLERAVELDPTLNTAVVQLFLTYVQQEKLEEALETARHYKENNPESAAGYNMEGFALSLLGQADAALKAFVRAQEVEPGDWSSATNLADHEFRQGNVAEARRLLSTALERNPEHVPTMLRLAVLENSAQRMIEAQSLMERAIETAPEMLEPRVDLSRHHLGLGRPAEALEAIQPILFANRGNQLLNGLLRRIGTAELEADRPEAAVRAFQHLVDNASSDVTSHFELARAYERVGDQDRLLQSLNEALRIDPKHVPSRELEFRYLFNTGKMDEARERLAELRVSNPRNARLARIEGQIASAQGRHQDAVAAYETAYGLTEVNFDLIKLSEALIAAGQPGRVEPLTSEWLSRYPHDIETRAFLAHYYESADRVGEAEAQYREILDLAPDDVRANNNLALIRLAAEDLDEALILARKAQTSAPENPNALDTLGQVLLQRGEPESALGYFVQATERAPNSPMFKLHQAETLVRLGREGEATTSLQGLIDSHVDFPGRARAEELLKALGK